ncbi:MAG: hypothetical protein NTW00_03985 [Hyphomicrobiales bacterium]|nr:hypothetical protein [Hyphomicrobiales bacterium]
MDGEVLTQSVHAGHGLPALGALRGLGQIDRTLPERPLMQVRS